MEDDHRTYHLRAEKHEVEGYWYTWCRFVVPNSIIAKPPFDGRQRICQRCCPRPDILTRWIEEYGFGA